MTTSRTDPRSGIEKAGDGALLRALIGFVARRRMDREVAAVTGAGDGARSPDRQPRRHSPRAPMADPCKCLGAELPTLGQGTDFPSFLAPRRASEQAIAAVIQDAYLDGISMRAVDDLVSAAADTGMSKSGGSRLCKAIGARVQAVLNRPLDGEWPFVWLEASHVKARRNQRIVSRAVIMAVGSPPTGVGKCRA